MNKWYGKVGYVVSKEVEPGVFRQTPREAHYHGDILEYSSRWSSPNKVNEDVGITARISIMADPFAYQNFSRIRYAEFMDTVWEVSNAKPQFPRIILTLGGVYNGERAQA